MSKLLIEEPLVGSDIEFFIIDTETNEIVSAEGLVKGTKEEPYHFNKENDYFATSLDNVTYEGNIPPAKTSEEFVSYVKELRNYMDSSIPKTLKTLAKGSARLDWKYLETENARHYGCSPSINAWTEIQEMVDANKKSNLRGAGFHLHVGYKEPDYDTNILIIKVMDLTIGVPSVLIEPADERKKVGYGQAGNHRHCRYGVEYRTLSSYFASDDKLIKWCFDQTQLAIDIVNNGNYQNIIDNGELIQNTINKSRKADAEKLVKKFNLKLP